MRLIFLFCLVLAVASCDTQPNSGETTSEESTVEDITAEEEAAAASEFAESSMYDPASVDDEAADWISNLLVTKYLTEDLQYLEEDQRTYQFYKVDLNEDGLDEYFVRFMNSWFCGSGGCTLFLLSNEGEMITKFTVTNPPVFVEEIKKNGWSVLLVQDRGEWKELTYDNGSYPPNPTVLSKASFDAPSASARIIFTEETGQAKTYTF